MPSKPKTNPLEDIDEIEDAMHKATLSSLEHVTNTNRGILTIQNNRLVRVYPDGHTEDVGPRTNITQKKNEKGS